LSSAGLRREEIDSGNDLERIALGRGRARPSALEGVGMPVKRFIVSGVVQGVGFRAFTRTCAEALGISGWVRNTADGRVEVHAEGSEEMLAELEFDLGRGARYARVASVEGREVPGEECDGFVIAKEET